MKDGHLKRLSFNSVMKIIRQYEKEVLARKHVKVRFLAKAKSEYPLTKNSAYCTEKCIYMFCKKWYSSPEHMAMAFAHESCHIDDFYWKPHESVFDYELKIYGRTPTRMHKIFNIKLSKAVRKQITKNLIAYYKQEAS